MGRETKIEYCDSTLNLLVGCDGCELYNRVFDMDAYDGEEQNHCYAAELVNRYKGRKGWPEAFHKPELFPYRFDPAIRWKDLTGTDRPDKPWMNGYPRVIFLNDLSDTFTRSAPKNWPVEYMLRMEMSPHIWLHLTKRPEVARHFFSTYTPGPNSIIGTTVTSLDSAWRIPRLLDLPLMDEIGGTYWLSLEPLLERVSLKEEVRDQLGFKLNTLVKVLKDTTNSTLWVAAGGESGANRRPCNPDWLRRVADECGEAGIPFFPKQIDKVIPLPEDLHVKEMFHYAVDQ